MKDMGMKPGHMIKLKLPLGISGVPGASWLRLGKKSYQVTTL